MSRYHWLSNFQGRFFVKNRNIQKDSFLIENTKSFISTKIKKNEKAGEKEVKCELQICLYRLKRKPPKSVYISGKTKQKWGNKGHK